MIEALAPLSEVPWLALSVRMSAVAIFVTIVAVLSQRVGPFFGAMAASLPIYTGPVFLFLAIDQSPEYLARIAIGSIVAFSITPTYILIYALMARGGYGMLPSLLTALAAWFCCAIALQLHDWTLAEAVIFAIPAYSISLLFVRRFTEAVPIKPAGRSWIDLPLRVLLVSIIVGIVNAVSPFIPDKLTGILAIMPTVTSSLIMVLHGRIGGPATSVLLAHSVYGMIGMLIAVTLIAFTVVAWGPALSLSAALAICVSWNLMLIAFKHGRALFNVRPPREPPRA